MFGSATRTEGSVDSDIDILAIRPDRHCDDDPAWRSQLDQLTKDVPAWSGNACELLELSKSEIAESMRTGRTLVHDLRRDAVPLGGALPSSLLRQHRAAVKP